MRESNLLTAEEVMAWLKVSLVTIRRWTSSGYIPHVKLGLRMVRYRKEDIEAWLAKRANSGRTKRIPEVVLPIVKPNG